jgi:hypothetical protein
MKPHPEPTPTIRKVVRKRDLGRYSEVRENLAYWLSRSPEERVAALEHLRRTHIGSAVRLQRCVRIARLSRRRRDTDPVGEE